MAKPTKLRGVDGGRAPKPAAPPLPPTPISMVPDDAETNYPISEWMVPATDANGHDAKVFCRCPPAYKGQISAILQKRKYPWETESDMVRVAVHRLLNDVSKDMRDPEITSQQAILNSLVEMCSREMEYVHFKDVLVKLQATVDQMVKNDAAPVAKKIIRLVKEQVDSFEETYWKKRYQTELIDKYETLLQQGEDGEPEPVPKKKGKK